MNEMMTISREDMESGLKQAVPLLKIMSNPIRLSILCLLLEGEKTVSELTDALDIRQANVSQQLSGLRSAGLVSTRRDAQMIWYGLASIEAQAVLSTLHQLYCTGQKATS